MHDADAINLVRNFLDTMERRDLEGARSYLDPRFTMTFPGNVVMRQLEELVEWSKPRYRAVAKTYEHFDVANTADTALAVYAFGALAGERLDGTHFSGIRFIDRFEIGVSADGTLLIVDQKVWNDLAEVESRA